MPRFHATTIYEALGREPVHPFPARMAPGIALQIMSNATGRTRILDPMMGSGTVLAMARSLGHQAIGYDIDPLAVLISRVWTGAIDIDEVYEAGLEVLERARVKFAAFSEGRAYPEHADKDTREFIRYWFDGYTRRQLAALSLVISEVEPTTTREALWCAFSRLIIAKQAGASLALDLSHSRPHRSFERAPAKPFNRFLSALDRVIDNSVDRCDRNRGPAPLVRMGDARRIPLQNGSVDLVLTSPPYLNAIDYIRCSKFSLVWMGHQVDDLRTVRAASIGTEVGANAPINDPAVVSIVNALKVRDGMTQRHQKILARYIYDMREAMSEASRVLADSGAAVYVVGENTLRGTYIRTSVIIKHIAALVGLHAERQHTRNLPANRRYLPPPVAVRAKGKMNARMRREVILTFSKA